ncbi:MAG: tRNA 2-thiouridine(34) synthase MnmA [Lachnospiraceae bacterium]|nr:tRNA 2-thiouridine(34) synthase MnmA [Lachnospiraceae bacterium]
MKRKTVVVGMSGGVDSSVAAWLLQQQGYRVIGVTIQMWHGNELTQEDKNGCCGLSVIEDARRIAQILQIPYYVMDCKRKFKKRVVDYFIEEYLHGKTPNPCIVCNRYVKWEALLQKSIEIKADYIATGHYARIAKLSNGRYAIRNSVTPEKDQTYVLYNLTQKQLAHTLMPVGNYRKKQIREIAEKSGLSMANKHDSQEICFVPDKDYAVFIEKSVGRKMPEGNFVNNEGKILGCHKGIIHYTLGQRRGLGLSMGRRMFVREIRPETNEVVIGEGDEVFSKMLKANHISFMAAPEMDIGKTSYFVSKIRYGHRGIGCLVKRTGLDEIQCIFNESVRAVTPGQAVVFYKGDCVAGGGRIL